MRFILSSAIAYEFQAPSHSSNSCLLPSSLPPVIPSVCLSACISAVCTEWITVNIMSRKSKFLSNRIKMSVSLHEDVSTFYCCRRHKFSIKVLCAALSILLLLTLTCSSTKHTERIVAFLLQQWLRVRATVLLHTNTVCVTVIPLQHIKSNKEVQTAKNSYTLYVSATCCTKA